MRTERAKNTNQRRIERRQSRLKQTRQLIVSRSIYGLLNNQKWLTFFEWLEDQRFVFKVNTLLNDEWLKCDWIRELGHSSVLIDDHGDFIEFFEIKSLKTKKSLQLLDFLREKNIEFQEHQEVIEILGYRIQ